MDFYHRCFNAKTEVESDQVCREVASFSPNHRGYQECASYLERQWWPYRAKFVKTWTNRLIHYGFRTTSLAESSPAGLKDWLGSARNDVFIVVKMTPYYRTHLRRYIAMKGRS